MRPPVFIAAFVASLAAGNPVPEPTPTTNTISPAPPLEARYDEHEPSMGKSAGVGYSASAYHCSERARGVAEYTVSAKDMEYGALRISNMNVGYNSLQWTRGLKAGEWVELRNPGQDADFKAFNQCGHLVANMTVPGDGHCVDLPYESKKNLGITCFRIMSG